MSFIEKYKPKTYGEIIGNNKKFIQLSKEIKENPKNKYLIIGSSNLGKTSFVNIFVKENKYKLINININNIENIDKNIFTFNFIIKKLILIDNIKLRNLSYKDKTKLIKKINFLIEILNNTKNTLIILISDKNIKEFKKIKNIKINNFRMYKEKLLQKHIKKIFDNENIKYSDKTYEDIFQNIIENSNKNIEKIYLNIETLMLNNKKTIRFNEKTRNKIKKTKNDKFINDTYDLLNKSFKKFNINDKEELSNKESFYYNEPFIVGSNIRENYIKLSNYKFKKKSLEKIYELFELLSEGDIIEKKVKETQNYSISHYNNYYNYIIPVYHLQGDYKMFFNFPSIVSKDNKILNSQKKLKKLKKENERYLNLKNEDIIYINEYKLLK